MAQAEEEGKGRSLRQMACGLRYTGSYLGPEPGLPPPVVPRQQVGAWDDVEGAFAVGRREARHQRALAAQRRHARHAVRLLPGPQAPQRLVTVLAGNGTGVVVSDPGKAVARQPAPSGERNRQLRFERPQTLTLSCAQCRGWCCQRHSGPVLLIDYRVRCMDSTDRSMQPSRHHPRPTQAPQRGNEAEVAAHLCSRDVHVPCIGVPPALVNVRDQLLPAALSGQDAARPAAVILPNSFISAFGACDTAQGSRSG